MKNLHDITCISECDDVILCTRSEKFLLWNLYSKESGYSHPDFSNWLFDWINTNIGTSVTLGEINTRPVIVTMWFSKINNRLIGFVEPISQLVDYKMIEEWIESKNKYCYNVSNFLRVIKG